MKRHLWSSLVLTLALSPLAYATDLELVGKLLENGNSAVVCVSPSASSLSDDSMNSLLAKLKVKFTILSSHSRPTVNGYSEFCVTLTSR